MGQYVDKDYLTIQFKNYDRLVAEPRGSGGGIGSANFATFNEIASLFLEDGDTAVYDGDHYSV